MFEVVSGGTLRAQIVTRRWPCSRCCSMRWMAEVRPETPQPSTSTSVLSVAIEAICMPFHHQHVLSGRTPVRRYHTPGRAASHVGERYGRCADGTIRVAKKGCGGAILLVSPDIRAAGG